MTTRNLNALFAPQSVALAGASNEEGSVGFIIARNLLSRRCARPIMFVNPHASYIQGTPSFRTVKELPHPPDLAVIATPAASVAPLVEELATLGCRAAIVISAGLDESQRNRMLEAARPRLLRIVGPNCLGFLSGANDVNASFSHLAPSPGNIAFVTQSGAIATTMLDWAAGRSIGFSHIISMGDMIDVDFGDVLDYLALDPQTKAILLYVESISHARKFMSAARIAARAKPVIVVKAGRGKAGARAAASHTGALAGSDLVYDAAFRRAGMLRVDTLRQLFDAAETLASGLRVRGNRLMIVTNGGGLGVLATDALEQGGGTLAAVSPATMRALDAALPPAWSHGNPVDILGDGNEARYTAALTAIGAPSDCDGLLVMNCPTGVADSVAAARAISLAPGKHPPLLACWAGEATAQRARLQLTRSGVPAYETPHEAVQAFLQLVEYARNQEALLQTPVTMSRHLTGARDQAAAVIGAALKDSRTLLTDVETKRLLALYGIPVVETLEAATPTDAASCAERIGSPVALKILSRQITHKSDVGGVMLGLRGGSAVEIAARAMLETVQRAAPTAVLDGFTIQRMIDRPSAQELLVGASTDPTFGMVMLFGHGGVATEIVADRVVGLPPLNSALAVDMIKRTRVAKLLGGYRNHPPANLAAIAEVLVCLTDLVADLPEVAELDINPLLADAAGVVALDARIVLRPTTARGDDRFAVRPFPQHLAKRIELPSGAAYAMRPIQPTDANALMEMARRTSRDDLRLRFHGAMRELAPATAARLSQIDYDREMAFIAAEPEGAIAAVGRLVFDPNFESAEYAIIVRSDLHNHGLGRRMMAELLTYAQSRGAKEIWGDVLSENANMLVMAREMGALCAEHGRGLLRTTFQFDTRN